tara:strand:+ start:11583 stop:15557 length:3975 start_codon:yes stop_codon:yes gene_type:complete
MANDKTTLYKFKADLRGLIQLNNGLKEAKVNLDALKLGTAQYTAQVKKMKGAAATMNQQTSAIKKTTAGVKNLNSQGNKMVSIFRSASIAIVSAFAFRAIIGGVRGIITSFSDFESKMSAVKAISGATDNEFKKLAASALKLGQTTVFTASQVAELQEAYARLGFTSDEILAAQQGTISLAAGTGESLATSAETAGSVLRAFGLSAEQTGRVVDVMGASFTNSALNLERFKESMKFVAPVARAAGFTIEETSTMLMKLADNGLHGSIAGNALKNIFLRLGDANSKLNKSLGKTVQGLPDLIVELRNMKDESFGLTEATELLDKRSAPAFLALINSIDGLEGGLDTLNNAEGAISRMAAIRLDNLEGDMTLLKSAGEGLGIAIGETFQLGLRQSIHTFTKFMQSISQSSVAIDRFKRVFNAVVLVVKLLALRMAYLKVANIGLAISTGALSKSFRVYKISVLRAAAGTRGLTLKMHLLKGAIASTGIGLLVIGLGSLVGYLMSTSDEVGQLEMNVNRLSESFGEDIKEVMKHNESSQERVDLLRKLNQDYPDLLKNIDIEIASNRELLGILNLVNETKGERVNISKKQQEINDILNDYREQEAVLVESMVTAKQNLNIAEDYGNAAQIKSFTNQIQGIKDVLKAAKKSTQDKQISILDEIKLYEEMIDGKLDANQYFRALDKGEADKYRLELRGGYKEDLESFRDKGKAKQKILIGEQEDRLEDLKNISEYNDLIIEQDNVSIQANEDAAAALEKFKSQFTTEELNTIESYDGNIAKLNINIQEMERYVSDLDAALKKSGTGYDESALNAHRLNKTKANLKQLMDVEISLINDTFDKQRDKANQTYAFKTKKYADEIALMKTNQDSIKSYSNSTDENIDKQISKFLKVNKNKYKVLKEMDKDKWDKLLDTTRTGHDEYLVFLDLINKEEQDKVEINGKIINGLVLKNKKELQEIENNRRENELTVASDDILLKLDLENKGYFNFMSVSRKKSAHAKEQAKKELTLAEARYKNGELSDIAYAARKAEIARDLSDTLNEEEDKRLAKISDTYQRAAAIAMEWSANVAAFNIANIEEEHTKIVSGEQNKFERKLEIAEAAGGDTVAMQRTHDDKMTALEDQKNEKIRGIKKRQFQLQKINDITSAAINGAVAVTKVSAQTGIGAVVAAPLMAALVAAQIGMIIARKFVGAKGGITPTSTNEGSLDKFAQGGMVRGASHAQGGVKFAAGGRVVELEGGEAVINKRSTAMFKPQLSAMNVAGGGKKFEQGGLTPGTRAIMDSSKNNWTANDIAGLISGAINSQEVFVTESDISSTQKSIKISETFSTIFQ